MQQNKNRKTLLVVLAHPDHRSFNGSWAASTVSAAEALGMEVLFSDLCSMGFDAVECVSHYPAFPNEQVFDPLKAQEDYANREALPDMVAGEIAKLEAADWIIFHFPLWWFAPPAILKGWFDRVLVHGKLHTVDKRFDNGLFQGKKALFCVTTGASETECAFNGKEGDAAMLLWPVAYTLRYLGLTVLEHKLVHGVHGYYEGDEKAQLESRLLTVLKQQAGLLETFDSRPCLKFNTNSDFDANGKLKQSSPELSYFIRHSL